MLNLMKLLKPFSLAVTFIIMLVFVQTICDLKLPDLMSDIVNKGLTAVEYTYDESGNILKAEPKPDMDLIYKTGGIMLLVALLSGASTLVVSFMASRVSTRLGVNLRNKIFAHVEGFSIHEIDKFTTSSLITRTTNDVQQIQTVIFMLLRMLIAAPITCIGGIIMAVQKSHMLALNLAYVIPLLIILIVIMAKTALPLFRKQQKKLDALNSVARENLTGVKAIRAYNKSEYEKERFEVANEDLTAVTTKANRIISAMMPMMMLLMYLTVVIVMWSGAHLVNSESIQVGDIMAFIQYAFQIMFSLMMFAMMFVLLPRATASAERINEVLNTEPSVKDHLETVSGVESNLRGELKFKNVSFTYPGAENSAVEDISFELHKGETTAIIGGTGSGKSTIINLIMRFFDVTKGEISLNGIDIRKLKTADLRQKMGYVPQKAILFSGTISENIKFSNEDASEVEVGKAAEVAQASEFVEEKEHKFEEIISQGGSNVSGGQRQRLSIARALARHPEIYLFDDSFSALDLKTDSKLREALKEETKDASILIVAQRVSTIMNSDQIIVLDDGKIAGIGKHEELLQTCEVYKEIVYSQISKDEIEKGA